MNSREIYNLHGEDYFRKLEADVLHTLIDEADENKTRIKTNIKTHIELLSGSGRTHERKVGFDQCAYPPDLHQQKNPVRY